MTIKKLSASLKRRLIRIPRGQHHALIYHIHKRHSVSKKTLFYMKEYGPKSNLVNEIVKDSMPVILISILLTSIGGLALRYAIDKAIFIVPLVIMIPALNDMIGEMGSVIASRLTTALFLGKIKGDPWRSDFLKNLFATKIKVAILSAIYLSILALGLSVVDNFQITPLTIFKIISIGIFSSIIIVSILFFISTVVGIRIFKNGEDPNNFLIPMSTAVADLVTLVIVVFLAILLF